MRIRTFLEARAQHLDEIADEIAHMRGLRPKDASNLTTRIKRVAEDIRTYLRPPTMLRFSCTTEDAEYKAGKEFDAATSHFANDRNDLAMSTGVAERELKPGEVGRIVDAKTREPLKCAVCGGELLVQPIPQ